MNSAVNNFKQELHQNFKDILGTRLLCIHHGLCLQIIKNLILSLPIEFDVIDGVEKIHLISNAIDEWKA